jgi:CBS domain-containing protein
MKLNVVSISADDTLRIVHEIMELGRVRHLPVVRSGRLVGVVSERDLLHASLSNVIGIAREEQDLFLEGVKIGQVMSSPPTWIGPDASIQEAAALMAEKKIGCLPVVDGEKIAGILTETDLLHHFASAPHQPGQSPEAADDAPAPPPPVPAER